MRINNFWAAVIAALGATAVLVCLIQVKKNRDKKEDTYRVEVWVNGPRHGSGTMYRDLKKIGDHTYAGEGYYRGKLEDSVFINIVKMTYADTSGMAVSNFYFTRNVDSVITPVKVKPAIIAGDSVLLRRGADPVGVSKSEWEKRVKEVIALKPRHVLITPLCGCAECLRKRGTVND